MNKVQDRLKLNSGSQERGNIIPLIPLIAAETVSNSVSQSVTFPAEDQLDRVKYHRAGVIMLKFNKDHWKKKAEDEYYAAVTEQEKAKSEDQHMFEWNKRYREGKWLLKGVGKVKDEQMGTILEDKIAQDKRGKYIPEEDAKKKKKAEESGVGGAALTKSNPGRSYVGFVKSLIYSKEKKKKVSRVRNARFVIKEGIAKVLVQRDVVNERDRFISNNSQHIRMLQNVRLALSRPKLPPHHSDLENLKGADPPLSAEIAGNAVPIFQLLQLWPAYYFIVSPLYLT